MVDTLAGGTDQRARREDREQARARPVRRRTSRRGAAVTEDDILDLEREAFVILCGEPKTRERMQYMLMNNKPLRN